MNEHLMEPQEDNCIIREYYKSFYYECKEDPRQVQARLFPKEVIFSDIAQRSKAIYSLISKHYSATTNSMTQIAEAIDSIENSRKCNNTLPLSINAYTPFSTHNHTNSYSSSDNDNDNDSDSDEEPISISKLSLIIKKNNDTIQRLQSKLIEKQSKIPKITLTITQLNEQLKQEIKSIYALVSTFDTPSNEDLSNPSYPIIMNVISEILTKANNNPSIGLVLNKESINSFIKDIGVHIGRIPLEERRAIKVKLLEIKNQMKNNGSFYSHLYELLICEYDIISIKEKIKKGEEALIKTKGTIDEINAQIEKLCNKNRLFDQTKGVIKKRYLKSRSNSKDKDRNKEINVSKHQDEIDRLKLLIYNMDKNYVELLNQLSLKIAKPKDLMQKENYH